MGECFITRRGGGGGKSSAFPDFSYDGDYLLIDDGIDENNKQNWRIKFLTLGTFRLNKPIGAIDVFLVGGGAGGGNYLRSGGGGGYTATVKNITLNTDQDYSIVIGAGGEATVGGGTTSAFGTSALGGQENAGGCGGGGGTQGADPGYGGKGGSDGSDGEAAYGYNAMNSGGVAGGKGQGTTTREFGEATGDLYAGGGGGGSLTLSRSGKGGDGGGGAGDAVIAPINGQANTGGGGGGHNGAGGSGIVIIRNAR